MIIIVLILGLFLRLISLNQSFWLDEATSILTVKMSMTDFLNNFIVGDFHPPLYYLFLRVWSNFFGTGEVPSRFLSVLFGVGTVYLLFLIAKKISKHPLIPTLLLATAPLHVYYSQETRMYAMSTFLITLSILFFIKILSKKRGTGDWVLFSIIMALISITDYLPLLILPTFWLYVFLIKKDLSWWKKFLLSHLPFLGVILIWFPFFLKQFNGGLSASSQWIKVLGELSIKNIFLIPIKFTIGRISLDNKTLYYALIFLITSFLIFLFSKSIKLIKSKNIFLIIILWLFIPFFLSLLISIKFPILNYFRFLFILPAFYLILGITISSLKKPWNKLFLVTFLIINLVTTSIYLFNPKFQREDWRSLAMFVDDKLIVFPATSQREALLYYNPKANIIEPNRLDANLKEIYLIRYVADISDPKDITRQKIESLGFQKTSEYGFNGVIVWKYGR